MVMPREVNVAAIVEDHRPSGLGADHFHAVGNDLDVGQILEEQVRPMLGLHAIASRRHDHRLLAGVDLGLDVALEIEFPGNVAAAAPQGSTSNSRPATGFDTANFMGISSSGYYIAVGGPGPGGGSRRSGGCARKSPRGWIIHGSTNSRSVSDVITYV